MVFSQNPIKNPIQLRTANDAVSISDEKMSSIYFKARIQFTVHGDDVIIPAYKKDRSYAKKYIKEMLRKVLLRSFMDVKIDEIECLTEGLEYLGETKKEEKKKK